MKIIETKAYQFELSQEEYLSLNTTINLFKEIAKEDSELEIFKYIFEGDVIEIDGFRVLANLLEDGILMRSE